AVVVDVESAVGQLTRQDRFHRLIDERARFRLPDAVLRRMQPKLEQYEIRFQGRIGGKFGAPVSVLVLKREQVLRGQTLRAAGCDGQRGFQMKISRTHCNVIVVSCEDALLNSVGSENRTSSSTNSISSRE